MLRGTQKAYLSTTSIDKPERYMRHFLQKPRDMSVREFATQLDKINKYFPPSNKNNKLPTDKLMDIAEFSIPVTWQKTMIMHGFDPVNHTIHKFIEFCERIEFTEGNK